MKEPVEKKNITRFVNIMGGQEEEYDICVSVEFFDKNRINYKEVYTDFIYLGKGFVSQVEGEAYNGKIPCHFWKYK